MKIFTALAMLSFAALLAGASSAQKPGIPPAWAYPVNPPDFKPAPDDGTPRHVPDSTAAYTLTQRDRFIAPDWHPGDHPPMPGVVAHGRKPDVRACGFCHRADGPGGPENASLAGLPAVYIAQQVRDLASGARKTSVPERVPTQLMTALSKAATAEEIEAAAAYFSALKPRATITVTETKTVPKTFVAGWFLAAVKAGEKEPIGNASSRSRKISNSLKAATHARISSLTSRSAALRKVGRSSPAAEARRFSAGSVTDPP